MKILIVEDEPDLAASMSATLTSEEYMCSTTSTIREAMEKLAGQNYDLVVLDLTLPDGNGLSVLEHIKSELPQTATVIVSARGAVEERIRGLDLGADDYLVKPFHLSELISRVRAVLRRQKFAGQSTLVFEEITIDTDARNVTVAGKAIELTPREYVLLLYFVVNKKRILTKESIAAHVWGEDMDLFDHFDFIYTHVKNLRRKIQAAGGGEHLQTVYGVGYRFSEA